MGSICRLCLHKNNVEEMKNVFEFTPKYFQINITEILYWIFDVEIVVEDHYSKLICYKCMNVIESVGKYRQFFQVNQTFLHERRCPPDYEVKSGWYNTRDIGTNTDFMSNSNNAIKSANNSLDRIGKKHVKFPNLEEINTTQGRHLMNQRKQNEEVEWINVPFDIFKQFSKPDSVKNNDKKGHDRIDVPAHIFSYYSPCVTLPDFKEECSNEGITKVEGKYYKFENHIPHIQFKRIEDDKDLLKKYQKTGKFTFKKVSVRTQNNIRKKRKLICDYYYRMPTSALRELISETNNEKLTQVLSITSLVKTNEIHVHVCKYCSKVFKFKKNLSNHYLKIHKKLLRNKYKISSKKKMNNSVEVDPMETSSDFKKSDEHDTSTNNLKDEIIHNFNNANVNRSLMQTEDDPLSIPVSECFQRPSSSGVRNSSRNSIRVKDVRQLINITDFEHDNYHIDYLRTVILGKSTELNPKISYYSDGLKEHDYSCTKNQLSKLHHTAETSSTEIELLGTQLKQNPRRKKINSNIAKFIKKRLNDIKKTRQELEKMTKLRFALYNEIENCNIKSSILALEQKLQTTKTNNDLV